VFVDAANTPLASRTSKKKPRITILMNHLKLSALASMAILLSACATVAPEAPVLADLDAPAPGVAAPLRTPAPKLVPARASASQVRDLQSWVEQQKRLYTVAAPLLMSNAALCKRNARNVPAFVVKTRYSYSDDMVAAAKSAFGLSEQPQVMLLFPESGAVSSGLLEGDVLLAVGDVKIAPGPNAERDANKLLDAAAQKARAPLNLTIRRLGTVMTVNLGVTRACAFTLELGDTDVANSYTDGRRVMVTRGMLDAVRSDEELAYVLAKEIAQAALARTAAPGMRQMMDRLTLSSAPPGANSRLPSITPYVPVTDATADKLALFMLIKASIAIDEVPAFWLRLANRYPATIAYGHTALHPSTSYRVSVMRAVTSSIKQRQLNDLPLVP
jgi:hypothetical protein